MIVNMPRIANPFSGVVAGNNIKKQLEEKNKERSKVYGFIGMDIYDLYKQGKVNIQELDVHFEKMKALEQEIADLEAERQRQELQSKGNSVCSCGQPLTTDNRFCPSCGKPVDSGMITCTCGKIVKNDLKFCSYCGRNLQDLISNATEQGAPNEPGGQYRECICGARVPEGQFMCMECGRKIEN